MENRPSLRAIDPMELAGLEPATSWVRSSGGGMSGASKDHRSPAIADGSTSVLTTRMSWHRRWRTRLVPAGE
jgi:hypothetical protein